MGHLQDRTAVFQDDVDLALLLVVEDLDQLHHVLVVEGGEQPDLGLCVLLAVGDPPQLSPLHDLDGAPAERPLVNRLLDLKRENSHRAYKYLVLQVNMFVHSKAKTLVYLCVASLAEHVAHHVAPEHLGALLSVVEYHVDGVHSMYRHETDQAVD